MRHLFVELPYYTAEYLNLWMKSDSDIKPFYKAIKSQCPETIFHGTDVGHQYLSTGERYLEYLKENGQVFVIYYTKTDGSVTRLYYRSDGGQWNGSPSTAGISVE